MSTFRVLDLCGCANGAGAGYQRAGAHVTSVDLDPKALAESTADVKVQGDALRYLGKHGDEFDLVAMSWPCQRWAANGLRLNWPDLITPPRARWCRPSGCRTSSRTSPERRWSTPRSSAGTCSG